MPTQTFNPTKDIPSLKGKIILITGGTAGLGAGSILELSKHQPAHIFFSGRNQTKATELIARVQKTSPNVPVTFIKCDIASLKSVQEAAKKFKAQAERLDLLMLNAGIMATPASMSPEGYEIQFATNHLGHALLVKLLMPLMEETAKRPGSDVRVVNMASLAYKQAPSNGIDFASLKTSQANLGGMIPGPRWSRYGQSKLAQILYSKEIAKHHPSITSVSVHPGFIMTGLFDGLPLLTALPPLLMSLGKRTPVEEGHYAQCWAATCEKEKLRNGGYYEPIGRLTVPSTTQGKDEKLAGELWNWTQRELEGW